MNTPPPDDRPPPSPAAPEVLEYERPATGALAGRPTLSAVAVAAFAVGLVGAGGSMLLGRQVFTYQPLVRLELLPARMKEPMPGRDLEQQMFMFLFKQVPPSPLRT